MDFGPNSIDFGPKNFNGFRTKFSMNQIIPETGAKHFRCLELGPEPEPEILVPAPQPWCRNRPANNNGHSAADVEQTLPRCCHGCAIEINQRNDPNFRKTPAQTPVEIPAITNTMWSSPLASLRRKKRVTIKSDIDRRQWRIRCAQQRRTRQTYARSN